MSKYKIQQLVYELIVFWHGQYGDDKWDKICLMTYRSLEAQLGLINFRLINMADYSTWFNVIRWEVSE